MAILGTYHVWESWPSKAADDSGELRRYTGGR
jgi:hypothetical protein